MIRPMGKILVFLYYNLNGTIRSSAPLDNISFFGRLVVGFVVDFLVVLLERG